MTTLAAILLFALTRAEIIERLKTPPVTHLDGLVQVYADCPADMRREYQGPIATFVSDTCNLLYRSQMIKPKRFEEPGIIVHVGSVRTNVADVVVSVVEREKGGRFTRIRLPAPGYSDQEQLRTAVVKAFCLAVKGEEIDDDAAEKLLRDADPELRIADVRSELKRWREDGEFANGHDDEYYLLQLRKILAPGVASREDVLNFASRLRLYPSYYGCPFCGRYESLSFEDAIELSQTDLVVRLAAVRKVRELLVYGGGHGERMTAAVQAYGRFLTEVAKGEKPADELRKMLAEAEEKLKEVAQ